MCQILGMEMSKTISAMKALRVLGEERKMYTDN